MHRVCLFFILLLFAVPCPAAAQEDAQLAITSPAEGQIIQGLVTVTGTASALGFSSYQLSFAYEDDPTETWFVLATGAQPVIEGELGSWDTTTLTDGDYRLRLQLSLLDGSVRQIFVSGLRLRNYTAVPTATFTATATAIVQFAAPTAQLVAPAPVTALPSLPTPTPLPPNPAILRSAAISAAVGRGAALAFLLFVVFGIFLRLRRE